MSPARYSDWPAAVLAGLIRNRPAPQPVDHARPGVGRRRSACPRRAGSASACSCCGSSCRRRSSTRRARWRPPRSTPREASSLPVAAPIVNNVVVTASYLLFYVLRARRAAVTRPHAGAEAGSRRRYNRGCRRVLRGAGGRAPGAPASPCALASTRATRWCGGWPGRACGPPRTSRSPRCCLGVVLVLANRIEGGVVAYQVAFTLFLLPHALFAVPALTALFPRLSRQALSDDWAGFSQSIRRGIDAIAFFALGGRRGPVRAGPPAGPPVSSSGRAPTAPARRGDAHCAASLPASSATARSCSSPACFYALHDARTPALANAALVAVGSGGHGRRRSAGRTHPTRGDLVAGALCGLPRGCDRAARRAGCPAGGLASGSLARVVGGHARDRGGRGHRHGRGEQRRSIRLRPTRRAARRGAGRRVGGVVFVGGRLLVRPAGRGCSRNCSLRAVTEPPRVLQLLGPSTGGIRRHVAFLS